MKAAVAPSDYLERLRLPRAANDQDPAWLTQARGDGLYLLEHASIPTRKSERWRYAGAQRLFQQLYQPAMHEDASTHPADLEAFFCAGQDALRVVTIDGRLVPSLSALQDLPPGVHIGSLLASGTSPAGPQQVSPGQLVAPGRNVFTAMNAAGHNDGLLLWVGDGVSLDRPIEVLHLNTGEHEPRLLQPRNQVHLGRDASVTLVEHYLSPDPQAKCFCNAVSEFDLGPGARLNHLQHQDQGLNGLHLCTEGVRLAQSSQYIGTRFALGGIWARNEIDLHFTGRDASADLGGLFTVGDGQYNDIHLDVAHSVPGCHSQARFKGLLHGAGRGVLDGRILVDKNAQATEAHLHNANLMLVEDAEIDTRPTLEIYADDVQCSHGATVGQLDPAHVYYLRSRGIDPATAGRLLSLGFARETLERSPYPLLSERIDRALENRLVAPDAVTQEDSA